MTKSVFKLISIFSAFSLCLFISSVPLFAQETECSSGTCEITSNSFYQGKVLSIKEGGEVDIGGEKSGYQIVEVKFLDGDRKGEEKTIEYSNLKIGADYQKLKEGETVVVMVQKQANKQEQHFITDKYRLPNLLVLAGIFILFVFLIGGLRGFGSILGLGFSFIILIKLILPLILKGINPLLATVLGSFLIIPVTLYLSHGFSKRTHAAFLSMISSLVLGGILSVFFIDFIKLTGLGTEAAFYVQTGLGEIDLRGLLLSGTIIGALGVLDDVTAAQSNLVFELFETDDKLTLVDLFKKGMKVGREHIASMVNTLFLVYAGASMAILLLFSTQRNQPIWTIVNSEMVAEEIVRTLSGSLGLLFAVPLTTLVAAYLCQISFKRQNQDFN